jgi:hypothetical protein
MSKPEWSILTSKQEEWVRRLYAVEEKVKIAVPTWITGLKEDDAKILKRIIRQDFLKYLKDEGDPPQKVNESRPPTFRADAPLLGSEDGRDLSGWSP